MRKNVALRPALAVLLLGLLAACASSQPTEEAPSEPPPEARVLVLTPPDDSMAFGGRWHVLSPDSLGAFHGLRALNNLDLDSLQARMQPRLQNLDSLRAQMEPRLRRLDSLLHSWQPPARLSPDSLRMHRSDSLFVFERRHFSERDRFVVPDPDSLERRLESFEMGIFRSPMSPEALRDQARRLRERADRLEDEARRLEEKPSDPDE